MKDLLKNFALFIVLSIVFSALTACTTGSMNNAATDAPNTGSTDVKKSDDKGYPSAPSAIAQAEIKMLDGGTFKLEDKKGKVVLFNLWGIWCGPCIQEMPHLVQMQEKYKDKNFEIVGLNVGDEDGNEEGAEAIKAFVEKQKLNYQIGWADRKLFEEFARVSKLAGVPQSVLINREGRMIGIFSGGGPKIINSMKETVDKAMVE